MAGGQCTRGGGGEVAQQSLVRGVPPRGPTPHPFMYHFLREKPFTFLDKNFASLLTAVKVLSLNMNKLQNQNVSSTLSQP